jgi:hypothetical protein
VQGSTQQGCDRRPIWRSKERLVHVGALSTAKLSRETRLSRGLRSRLLFRGSSSRLDGFGSICVTWAGRLEAVKRLNALDCGVKEWFSGAASLSTGISSSPSHSMLITYHNSECHDDVLLISSLQFLRSSFPGIILELDRRILLFSVPESQLSVSLLTATTKSQIPSLGDGLQFRHFSVIKTLQLLISKSHRSTRRFLYQHQHDLSCRPGLGRKRVVGSLVRSSERWTGTLVARRRA